MHAQLKVIAKFKMRLDFMKMIKLSIVITVTKGKKNLEEIKNQNQLFQKPLYFRHYT